MPIGRKRRRSYDNEDEAESNEQEENKSDEQEESELDEQEENENNEQEESDTRGARPDDGAAGHAANHIPASLAGEARSLSGRLYHRPAQQRGEEKILELAAGLVADYPIRLWRERTTVERYPAAGQPAA